MDQVNALMSYWSDNPPTHIMLKGFFQVKKRPGLPPIPAAEGNTTQLDVARMLGAGMASSKGKPKRG